MNRNQNSHFAQNPTNIDMQRSRFDRPSTVTTSFNVGEIIPFYVDEVLPGDTFSVDTSKVVRLQTPITPFMGNIFLDTYYFYVPNRLVWSHWREFNGENTQSAWLPTTEYAVPQIVAPSGGWQVGTIADYMGLPTGVDNISVCAFPFRGYALIMNEWFRDQNLSDPLNIPLDETTVTGVNTGTFVTDVAKGGKPYTAAKYFDYFTSCLPAPQRGEDVEIQLASGDYPVVRNSAENVTFNWSAGYNPVQLYGVRYGTSSATLQLKTTDQVPSSVEGNVSATLPAGSTPMTASIPELGIVTINQLRLAFQIQKLYEKDARGGKCLCLHVKKTEEKNWKAA